MKITPTNARKLSQAVWRDRVRRFAPVVVGAVVLLGVAVLFNNYRIARADPTLEVHTLNATIIGMGNGRPARGAFIIHARTSDGRDVDALATTRVAPPPGVQAILSEARHKSGRLTYELIRTVD